MSYKLYVNSSKYKTIVIDSNRDASWLTEAVVEVAVVGWQKLWIMMM